MSKAFLYCLGFTLCSFFLVCGCSEQGVKENTGPSKQEVARQLVSEFGNEGTVVEVYSERFSLTVALENDRGVRIRAFADDYYQHPARGDRWTIVPRHGGVWPALGERISDQAHH